MDEFENTPVEINTGDNGIVSTQTPIDRNIISTNPISTGGLPPLELPDYQQGQQYEIPIEAPTRPIPSMFGTWEFINNNKNVKENNFFPFYNNLEIFDNFNNEDIHKSINFENNNPNLNQPDLYNYFLSNNLNELGYNYINTLLTKNENEITNDLINNNLILWQENGNIIIEDIIDLKNNIDININLSNYNLKIGENTTVIIKDEGKNNIYSATAIIEENYFLRLTILDLIKNQFVLNIKFSPSNEDGWFRNDKIGNITIPYDANLSIISLFIFTLWDTIQKLENNNSNQIAKNIETIKNEKLLQTDPCDLEPDPAIPNWYYCKFPIPPKCRKETVTIYVPFCGQKKFSLYTCCRDLELRKWCGNLDPFDEIFAQIDYYLCYLKTISYQISQMSGFCMWMARLSVLFGIILWVLKQIADLLTLKKKLVKNNVLPNSRQNAIINLNNINEDFNKILISHKTKKDGNIQTNEGFDKKMCCICGGDWTTFCCNPDDDPDWCYVKDEKGNFIYNEKGNKRRKDLCNRRNEFPCYPCRWVCEEDEKTGKMNKILLGDPNNKYPCCPGTGTLEEKRKLVCLI